MSHILSIVLTGGPGGGKTTFMREMCADSEANRRWIPVPETAPLLFRAGFDASAKRFQRAAVGLQIALEDICSEAARPDQVLLCHRGTLDPLAYWLRNGWDEGEFFNYTRTTCEQHYRRYSGVIHLQTAAVGAERFYNRWPDAHRPETIEQAAEIDLLCARAWSAHPRYILIDNAGRDWPDKTRTARDAIAGWLSIARK